MSDSERLAAIRQRTLQLRGFLSGELTGFQLSVEDFEWLLARVGELEAELEDVRKDTLTEAVNAIHAHADKHVPAEGGNYSQLRMRRHLLIAERVVGNLDPITPGEILAALKVAEVVSDG